MAKYTRRSTQKDYQSSGRHLRHYKTAYSLLNVMCKFVINSSPSDSERQVPWERDSHFKKSEMLVALLRGVQNKIPLFLAVKVSFRVAREEIIKNAFCSS